jgi:hypothetical protein
MYSDLSLTSLTNSSVSPALKHCRLYHSIFRPNYPRLRLDFAVSEEAGDEHVRLNCRIEGIATPLAGPVAGRERKQELMPCQIDVNPLGNPGRR